MEILATYQWYLTPSSLPYSQSLESFGWLLRNLHSASCSLHCSHSASRHLPLAGTRNIPSWPLGFLCGELQWKALQQYFSKVPGSQPITFWLEDHPSSGRWRELVVFRSRQVPIDLWNDRRGSEKHSLYNFVLEKYEIVTEEVFGHFQKVLSELTCKLCAVPVPKLKM